MELYCKEIDFKDKKYFSDAISIFDNLKEFVMENIDDDETWKEIHATYVKVFENRKKRQHREAARSIQDLSHLSVYPSGYEDHPMTSNDLMDYIANKKNQFKPVYQVQSNSAASENENFGRYDFKKVSLQVSPAEKLKSMSAAPIITAKAEKKRRLNESDEPEIKPPKKAQTIASHKGSRDVLDDEEKEAKKRTVGTELQIKNELGRNYQIVTSSIGTLCKNLKNGLANSTNIIHRHSDYPQEFVKIYQDYVAKIWLLKLHACHLAGSFLILCTSTNSPYEDLLDYMVYPETQGQGGMKFWYAICSLIMHANKSTYSDEARIIRSEAKLTGPLEEFLKANKLDFGGTSFWNDTGMTTKDVQYAMIELDNMFARHFIGERDKLMERVLNHDPNLEAKVVELQELYDKPKSKIRFMVELNRLLPPHLRYVPYPVPSPSANSFETDEEVLIRTMKTCDAIIREKIEKDYMSQNNATKSAAKKYLVSNQATAHIMNQNVYNFDKGEVIRYLFGHNLGRKYKTQKEYATNVESKLGCKLVLNNYISTDGVQVRVYFYDTSKKKKQPIQRTASSVSQLQSIQVDQRKRSAVLNALPPITKIPEDEIPDQFIGIDLGEKYLFGACALNKDKNEVKNLAVKRSSLTSIHRSYQGWIKRNKPKDVAEMENTSPYMTEDELREISDHANERSNSDQINNTDQETPLAKFFHRIGARGSKLREFYGSKGYIKKKWDHSRAVQGERNRMVNALLRMVGRSSNKRVHPNDVKNSPIFIFGDATYDSAGSVTESFAQFVIDKLKSLGYRVYRVSEYFTSQVCPCCNNKVDNLSMRIKYCNHCKMHYHRDVMAGENMAMAGLSIAMTGDRPAYLKTNYTEARSRKPPDRNPGPSSSRQ